MDTALPECFKGRGFFREPPAGESRTVLAGGLYLHVIEAGPPEPTGPPLVLVHGLGAAWDSWYGVLPLLARRHRVIVPDLPGFGRSPKPDVSYSISWQANVLRELLQAMDARGAVLVGNSMGGHVCLEYALSNPGETKNLILAAPSGGQRPLAWKKWLLLGLLGNRLGMMLAGPDVIAWAIRRMFHRCVPECRELMDFYRDYLQTSDRLLIERSFVRGARGVLADPLRKRLGRVREPVLVIQGRQDVVISLAECQDVARRLPKGRLVIFDECGHAPQIEWPERFAEEVEGFLREAI